jgi:FKBP-type peptidyl-prolyl cis-trans isomerase (trigger factor)
MYGSDVFYQDAMDALGPDAFGFGIDDAKLEIVGAPTLDDMKLGRRQDPHLHLHGGALP